MGAQRADAVESLNAEDRRLVEGVAGTLRQIPAQGAPAAVFDALRVCMPIAGGLIGSMRASGAGAIVSHAVRLPDDVLEGWASAPVEQLSLMLAPLVPAAPGQLISDTQAIRGPLREQIELIDVLHSCGLGEAAGYKVNGVSPGLAGELRFLTFALERDRTFTDRDRSMLKALRAEIQASLDRLRLPLVPSQSILTQIVEERRLGFICVTRSGRCVELNQRAHELVTRYRSGARIDGNRAIVSRFAERAIAEMHGRGAWHIAHESGDDLEVSAHWLAKETHRLGEDLVLLMLQEAPRPRRTNPLENVRLTARQREIVRFLVETGLSYKEIALRLGIEEGTMRKHAENIYRRANVHSRPELVALFR
ncbi:LuxR C-terminal-related transcriptional regulator [Polyangium sp. 6x1]|uniref:helix-turn-helix transcriptional regulator n=1 Tax=Polyangium sp. 6x1 TaxID=3042689 RepID=UPI002482939A|nr:LuxR C-terminal-related transcriptional regulator [Polyangium sp. 6x1]MDI1443560.1 LuxR C-terminal-related transcriptional regulator [Polyangium sp. 6x1]